MTMTLEKIQGMNIAVGTPIEISVKTTDLIGRKKIVYFEYLDGCVIGYKTQIGYFNTSKKFGEHHIATIEDIKILEYKK